MPDLAWTSPGCPIKVTRLVPKVFVSTQERGVGGEEAGGSSPGWGKEQKKLAEGRMCLARQNCIPGKGDCHPGQAAGIQR
jgi:hypothetical protein